MQRNIARLAWQADETPAIGTERCRTADNRCTTARPHHTDTATAPLATSTTTCRLQDRRPGFPVSDSSGTWLPSRRLSSRRRRQRSSTLISSHRDLCRHTSNIFGDRCFTAAGPQLWNSLPISLRQCHSLEQFKRLLKTLLFSAWSHGALWHLRKSAPYINPLTYLLTYLLPFSNLHWLKVNDTTPILKSFYWLKVNECIEYKLVSLTYKVLTTSLPSYQQPDLCSICPHSLSVVSLSRAPTVSSLKITDRSQRCITPSLDASLHLWSQLPDSFRQPRQSCLDSPPHSLVSSSLSSSPLSSSITPSLFQSTLKIYLLNKSFPL